MLFIGGQGVVIAVLDESCLNNPDGPRMDATETLPRMAMFSDAGDGDSDHHGNEC